MPEPWISRRFAFDLPPQRIGVLLSRLRGAEARLAAAARHADAHALTRRDGDHWSPQEHAGHLHDLDALHLRRLDELAAGAETLAAADMTNRATWDARHNERPFDAVLADFARRRAELVQRLAALDEAGLCRSARHPRLQQPMRALDVAAFTAEHDDHHLARFEELLAQRPAPAPAALAAAWQDLPLDRPLPDLERRRVIGREAMISHVTLHRGCHVAAHAHPNEQFACVLSGVVRFTLPDGERILRAGSVLHLPGHVPHGAEALETAVVLDVFAPPSATTGVDARQG